MKKTKVAIACCTIACVSMAALLAAQTPSYVVRNQTESQTLSGPIVMPGINTGSLSGSIVVDGTSYAQTDAGIQSAINAAEAMGTGTTVMLAPGAYALGSALPIVITSSIRLVGSGRGTQLNVASTVGSTTDIFSIQPTGMLQGLTFSDFAVLPASGTPARHVFNVVGTSGELHQLTIERVATGLFGGHSINSSGSGIGNGSIVDSVIQNNWLTNGVSCYSCGDLFRVLNNKIGGDNVPAAPDIGIDIDALAGTSMQLIKGNDIQNRGGSIHIGNHVLAARIIDNQMQTSTGFTGSNGALVDLDSASSESDHVLVSGNSFQVVGGITANGIRLNKAINAKIENNTFERGAGASVDIQILSGSFYTHIGHNDWTAGGPLASMIADAGEASVFDFSYLGSMEVGNAGQVSYLPRGSVEMPVIIGEPDALTSDVSKGINITSLGTVGLSSGVSVTTSPYSVWMQARNYLGANNAPYTLRLNPLGGMVQIGPNAAVSQAGAIVGASVTAAGAIVGASITAPPAAGGVVTLASGTGTVTNAAACTASATCVYSLTRCAPNSSTVIGSLSVGTINVGTSFVVNSLTATNTVATGDASTVCWRVN